MPPNNKQLFSIKLIAFCFVIFFGAGHSGSVILEDRMRGDITKHSPMGLGSPSDYLALHQILVS